LRVPSMFGNSEV